MTKRAYDPELAALIPTLPTVGDYATLEKIVAMREARAGMAS